MGSDSLKYWYEEGGEESKIRKHINVLPLNSSRNHIEPFFRVTHIPCRIILSLCCIRYYSSRIYIGISTDLFLCYNIYYFFSGKFFILCGLRHESLIGACSYQRSKELFFFISFLYIFTLISEHSCKTICFIFLNFIISDKIYQIDNHGYQAYENVVKTRVQEKRR
jgi:hypothetical protein